MRAGNLSVAPGGAMLLRKLGIIVLVVGVAEAGVWAWIHSRRPKSRHRLTIELSLDGQLKKESTVIEVKNQEQTRFGMVLPFVSRGYGDAAFFDLGSKGPRPRRRGDGIVELRVISQSAEEAFRRRALRGQR